jgi:hypothetical protein
VPELTVYPSRLPSGPTLLVGFFLDAISVKREARPVMRRFAVALTSAFVAALGLGLGCADDPQEPNAFQTQGNNDDAEESDTGVPRDMPSDPTTGDSTTGDPDPTTGDGDPDPTTGDGDPTPMCGNGIVDPGEQCDGGNLNGYSCTDLGYAGGTLACDPVTCTYDASGCLTSTDGGGGTTG